MLIGLSAKVFEELARKNSTTKADATTCEAALTLAILLSLPIRRKNLASLDLDRHFIYRRQGNRRRVFIEIPAAEVKNHQPLSFELSETAIGLLDLYKDRYRPTHTNHSSPWLFPGANPGCHKSPERIAANLSKFAHDRTGIKISIHQLRHVTAKIVLDHDPGQHETVRRLLGHKSLDTTISAYAGLNARFAAQALDRTLAGLRSHDNAGT